MFDLQCYRELDGEAAGLTSGPGVTSASAEQSIVCVACMDDVIAEGNLNPGPEIKSLVTFLRRCLDVAGITLRLTPSWRVDDYSPKYLLNSVVR